MTPKQRSFLIIFATLIFLACNTKTSLASFFEVHRGWNNAYLTPDNQKDGTAPGTDIDGKVGYPLNVDTPRAACRENAKDDTFITWIYNPTITSGTLPPGVAFGDSNAGFPITGIPTQRGHYIVTVASGPINCNGETFNGFTQQLRFHITGSGEVVQ